MGLISLTVSYKSSMFTTLLILLFILPHLPLALPDYFRFLASSLRRLLENVGIIICPLCLNSGDCAWMRSLTGLSISGRERMSLRKDVAGQETTWQRLRSTWRTWPNARSSLADLVWHKTSLQQPHKLSLVWAWRAPHCSRLRLPHACKQCRKAQKVQMLLRNKIAVRKHTVINMEQNQAPYRTQGGLPHK